MKILIDGDGCPVVDITVKLAKQYGVECIIFCDTAHVFQKDGADTVVCSKGADSVDFVIVNRVKPGDIVVTQDYGLAGMCLAKKAVVINQNGLEYCDENIDALLNSRHMAQKVRCSGGRIKGPAKRTHDKDEAFAQLLENKIKEA